MHAVLSGVGGVVVGALLGYFLCQSMAGKSLAKAKAEAAQIIERAGADAKTQADAVRIEAERQALTSKQQFEKEAEAARAELRETERRLAKREDLMDRKEETLAQRESSFAKQAESIRAREEKLGAKEAHLASLVDQQTQKLHQIADLSRDQAKEELLQRVEQDCRLDVAKLTRKITEAAEEDAAKQAREITLMAIQRYATEHTSESTVRTVAIPSDDMKGRIIGRRGT
jgi:ribonuclease Y